MILIPAMDFHGIFVRLYQVIPFGQSVHLYSIGQLIDSPSLFRTPNVTYFGPLRGPLPLLPTSRFPCTLHNEGSFLVCQDYFIPIVGASCMA